MGVSTPCPKSASVENSAMVDLGLAPSGVYASLRHLKMYPAYLLVDVMRLHVQFQIEPLNALRAAEEFVQGNPEFAGAVIRVRRISGPREQLRMPRPETESHRPVGDLIAGPLHRDPRRVARGKHPKRMVVLFLVRHETPASRIV
jgi:hypothetical protein